MYLFAFNYYAAAREAADQRMARGDEFRVTPAATANGAEDDIRFGRQIRSKETTANGGEQTKANRNDCLTN